MKALLPLLICCSLANCTASQSELVTPAVASNTLAVNDEISYGEILRRIGTHKLSRAVERPNDDGSLGRNKAGYFHVRFQINMPSISDYALAAESTEALELFLSTVRYSFAHQREDGSFEVEIPEALRSTPDYHPPSPADLASGTAFFASSLGKSLLSLEQSSWFTQSASLQDLREELYQLRPSIEKTLDYLLDSKDLLQQVDAQAPNRLLFNAMAYYTLGKYLSRSDAVDLAALFVEKALTQTDDQEGYFIEGGGWDSSYNGVAVKLAMELFLLAEEPRLRQQLKAHFVPAATWQVSRILGNGEISTEGNTRVFDGGESFLGAEKGVDYVKTIKSLYYFGILTNQPSIVELGDRVLNYYN